MKKKTEQVGLKGVARGAVGGQKGLVVFDEIFLQVSCVPVIITTYNNASTWLRKLLF